MTVLVLLAVCAAAALTDAYWNLLSRFCPPDEQDPPS